MKPTSVVIYSKNNCAACVNAKNMLKSYNMEFIEYNCDNDFEAFDYVVSQGWRSFPQIIFDGKLIGGFKDLQQKIKDYVE